MSNIPTPLRFASDLAAVAKNQHDEFHLIDENDEPLSTQIEKYWDAIPAAFSSVEVPWSAAFISFCVREAGAKEDEFEFAAAHAKFVYHAINHPAAFKGVSISQDSVRVGDIIQNNRLGNAFDFACAKSHDSYFSHSAIVIARGEDHLGKFALTVGGNESDSIRRVRVKLNDDGTIKQRSTSKYICLLKNIKRDS